MKCRVCDSSHLEPVINLGTQPWGNHFLTKEEVGKEPAYPLRVLFCHDCSTSQLDYTIPKEVMFRDHTYLSGITRTMSDHFCQVAQTVERRFLSDKRTKRVLDIGSNDGTQLKHFKDLGYDVLGVESSKRTAKIAEENGIPTLNRFFNETCAKEMAAKFDVINAAGVFYHLEELHSVTEGVREALHKDGVFIVQFAYMKSMVESCSFDQIYHEHLLYYTLKTIKALLNRHGLDLFDAYSSPIHGGSIIAYACHKGKRLPTDHLHRLMTEEDISGVNTFESYIAFDKAIQRKKETNLEYLRQKKKEGKTIYGMGAPVKGNTLLNYFGIGVETLDVLVEKNPLRRGCYSPGMHIPVVMEDEIDHPPDIYYVLAWNFKKEILENHQKLIDQGVEFYFPVNPIF